MANSVATPLIKQFATIPAIETMTRQERPGLDLDRHPVRPQPQHRPGRRRRAGGDRANAAAAAGEHDDAAELPQGEPGRRADPAVSRCRASRCRCSSSTISPSRSSRRRCRRSRRRRGAGVRRQKYRRPRPDRSDALAARGIGIDQVTTAVAGQQLDHPGRHAHRPRPDPRHPGGDAADQRRRVPPGHHRHPNGKPVRLGDVGPA